MEFPTIVYKDKGPHSRAGGTFDCRQASTKEEFDALIESGWKATMLEVCEQKPQEQQPVSANEFNDDLPASRKELFAKAHEIGIEVSKKMTNDEIALAIEEKIAKGG